MATPRHSPFRAALVLLAACGGASKPGCQLPLEKIGSTAPATLAPGNETGQDEDPSIHRDYEAALATAGVSCRMGAIHPFCTQR